jgi:hypothetical protein
MATPISTTLDFSASGRALGLPTPTQGDEAAPRSWVDAKLAGKITVGATAPPSPALNDLWVDTN